MDPYTALTKAWLDLRYRDSFDATTPNLYYAHQPIYGLGAAHCEPNHARRVVRLIQLLLHVRAVGGRTLLDVGGSEGYFAQLCRELFGMTTMSVDLSAEACRRAAEIFGVPGAVIDAAALPFATDSFDVVTCAEVVEHLADPVPAILELQRVARGAVVLATEEWLADAAQRDRELAGRRSSPHGERSLFADADLRVLFAPYAVHWERQVLPDLQRFGDDRSIDRAALRTLLLELAAGHDGGGARMGIVLTVQKRAAAGPTPRVPSDAEIVDHVLARACPWHLIGAPTPRLPWPAGIVPRCVRCGAALTATGRELVCACGERFAREGGVFTFLRERAPFAQRVDAMLAERGGAAHADQRAELLALARKLDLPFVPRTEWAFTDDGAVAAWRCTDGARFVGDSTFRIDGGDPQLRLDGIGCAPAAAGIVVVTMAVRLDDPTAAFDVAEVYWQTDRQLGHLTQCSVGVFVVPDGAVRSYRFEAPASVRGELLLGVRIDPLTFHRGDVRIEAVRFERSPDLD